MNLSSSSSSLLLLVLMFISQSMLITPRRLTPTRQDQADEDSVPYVWPRPWLFTFGNQTLTVDPNLSLVATGNGGKSAIVREAFDRYKRLIFKHSTALHSGRVGYDVAKLNLVVHSEDEELKLGVDESYTLTVAESSEFSIIGQITIDADSVFGALRGLETLSQLCAFDYGTKTVKVYNAPWSIQDKPRFSYRGLMLDTSRHYLPIEIIKQVIEAMSYAKFNVFHWHIVDEESFPLEVPTYSKLWKGAYTKWERYTIDDASEIVKFAKMRGINVLAEVDVPGHAESWGTGYPNLWPSTSCKEPLDVSKNFTFDLISGMLADMRKIFLFELFHLGGDEVHTDCWDSTPHVKQWLQDHNLTGKGAYQYFVLRAQEIAISLNWTPVNWEETFKSFAISLNPQTVVHNWLEVGICPKAVAKGFRCIFSDQGVWYLDHLDVPWESVYYAEPLKGITNVTEEKLVMGGEVCMWGKTADASNVQQTIWPRAASAAERLWSERETDSSKNNTSSVLSRLEYFRCLLSRRGVPAAPVTNFFARQPPSGPGSCYSQ